MNSCNENTMRGAVKSLATPPAAFTVNITGYVCMYVLYLGNARILYEVTVFKNFADAKDSSKKSRDLFPLRSIIVKFV